MDIVQFKSPIEISGLNDNKPYIELTTRLCYLDYANLNGVGLSSAATDSFDTLKNMPVVAKINSTGTKFGSHEVSIDDNGQIKFNTSAYGVHTEVWVEDNEVDVPNHGTMTVPCLFAKSKIWKRFSSVVSLIANKFANPTDFNGGLWSSWELQGEEWHLNDDNEKIYDKFTFLSNCLIDVYPAYGTTSKSLEVASSDFESELNVAFMEDVNRQLDELNKNNIKEEDEVVPKETSALTTRDLYQKVYEALNPKGWNSNPYYSVWEVYPEDHKVLAYDIDRASEDDYLVFTYTVSEDTISIGEGMSTKLSKILSERTNININLDLNESAKLLSEKEIQIKKLESENQTLSSDLNQKNEALVSASEKIEQLQASIEELTPFKTKVEEIEQAEREKEIAQKKEDLKKVALKGGFIEEAEFEFSEEIKSLLDNLDEKGIKAVIAERFMKKLEDNENSSIEVSNKNKNVEVKTNIDNEESTVDHKVIMSSFFKN